MQTQHEQTPGRIEVHHMQPVIQDRLLKLPEVLELVPVASSTWRRWVAEGEAPAKVKRGRSTFWRLSEVQDFINGSWQKSQ
ncbi:helix-turn-helix transcriptional regulator [Halodesulfovibrio aestuarii]|uniref:helix-turn-helix transcriptional regulator n=1 Tax=Halodesulfovibrio aestuarii TaxID=126333 RepID=UPI003D349508